MSLDLYIHPLSSYCQKVETALYENDTPFDIKLLDGSEPVASEFARLWPIGKFPILTDGDTLILETSIIIEYLDLHYLGRTRFIPADPDAAIEVRMLDRFFDNYVNAPQQRIVGVAIGADSGDEAALRAKLDTAYAWLDRWLDGRTWAAAGQFSLADCAAAPALLYADWTHPIPKSLTSLWAYRDRLLARPSYARALDEARPYRHMFPLGAPRGPRLIRTGPRWLRVPPHRRGAVRRDRLASPLERDTIGIRMLERVNSLALLALVSACSPDPVPPGPVLSAKQTELRILAALPTGWKSVARVPDAVPVRP